MGNNLVTLTPGAVDYDALVTQLGAHVQAAERELETRQRATLDAARSLDVLRGQLELAIQLRTIAKAGDHDNALDRAGAPGAAGAGRPE